MAADPHGREGHRRREARARVEDFLVGSDTWITPQWDRLGEIENGDRIWLAQLPADAARMIATGNAEVLFPPRR